MGDDPNTEFKCKQDRKHLVDDHQIVVSLTFWVLQRTVKSKNYTVEDNEKNDEIFEARVPVCSLDPFLVIKLRGYEWTPCLSLFKVFDVLFNLSLRVSIDNSLSCE